MIRAGRFRAMALVATLALTETACGPSSRSAPARIGSTAEHQAEADLIRAMERERLRALVEANVPRARQLHADDFQLINPLGGALSKAGILGRHRLGAARLPLLGARLYRRPHLRGRSGHPVLVASRSYCARPPRPAPAILAHRLL
jgi:uncharacterized protein DUF4440